MLSQIRRLHSTKIQVDRKKTAEAHHSINQTKLRDVPLSSTTSPHSNNVLSASFFLPLTQSTTSLCASLTHSLTHLLLPKDRTPGLAQDSRFPNQDALYHNRQTNNKLLRLSAAVPPTPHGFHKNPASCCGQARRGCGHRMSLLTTE